MGERENTNESAGRYTEKRRTHALFHITPTIIQEITFHIAATTVVCIRAALFLLLRYVRIETHIFSLLLPVKNCIRIERSQKQVNNNKMSVL